MIKMKKRHVPLVLGALMSAMVCLPASAVTVFPIDRAEILVGSKFDFKVEFDGVLDESQMKVTINGKDYRQFMAPASYLRNEDGKDYSSLILRDAQMKTPGTYTLVATDGNKTQTVKWDVYSTPKKPVAKNVILFVGDGLSVAHRTAARILSKGVVEGKALGKLAMDDMPHMALVSTAGTDSIITDSANAAHAYTTGHKSCVNALGVYCSRSVKTLDHPKVETITDLVKRMKGMAVGVITNSEIEDATPAAMVGHTRRRADFNDIVKMFYESAPEVIMGGGSPNFLPKSTLGSKRADETDYLDAFQKKGYQLATTAREMKAMASETTRMLGLFNTGNIDGVLDRKFLKKGTVDKFPDQPDLTEQLDAALTILSKNKNGFVLMVESARVDKYSHSMDWERAVFDTIMFDNAIKNAKDWAEKQGKRNDTLIMVVADHAHPMSLIGTVDDNLPGTEMREKVGIYAAAGYPNYSVPNAEGYPENVNVSKRLRLVFGAHPDYYETFRPFMDGENVPAVKSAAGGFSANERYKEIPGAVFMPGNLPKSANNGIHSGDDIILTATGPGAERVRGHMENTDVFRVMVEALALGSYNRKAKSATK